MEDFKGELVYSRNTLRIRVKVLFENKHLSISGDIYENGRDVGGGQCYEDLLREFPLSARLVELWIRWHLNDLNAGDAEQESYLRALRATGAVLNNYDDNCRALAEAELLEHNGYRYGTAWISEDVPEYVLQELKTIIKESK